MVVIEKSSDSLVHSQRIYPTIIAGCTSRVSNVVEVKVGHLGRIPLYLCKDCIIKFKDKFEVNK